MSQLYVIVLAIIVATLLAVAIYRATRVKTKADSARPAERLARTGRAAAGTVDCYWRRSPPASSCGPGTAPRRSGRSCRPSTHPRCARGRCRGGRAVPPRRRPCPRPCRPQDCAAPGMTAPLESVTVPAIAPNVCCAERGREANSARAIQKNMRERVSQTIVESPQREYLKIKPAF